MAKTDFSEFFDSINESNLPQPNPYLKNLKMGQIYYYVLITDWQIYMWKALITNFIDSTKRLVNIKATITLADGIRNTTVDLNIQTSQIPHKGQKKDMIYLTDKAVFCTNKQAVLDVIRYNLYENMTLTRRFSQYVNITRELKYKSAINTLKSL